MDTDYEPWTRYREPHFNKEVVLETLRLGLAGQWPGIATSKGHPKYKTYPYLLDGLLIMRPLQVYTRSSWKASSAKRLKAWVNIDPDVWFEIWGLSTGTGIEHGHYTYSSIWRGLPQRVSCRDCTTRRDCTRLLATSLRWNQKPVKQTDLGCKMI